MSTLSLRLAPSGALTLRQTPGFDHERALRLAVIRLGLMEPLRKRRADNLEGFMKPDPHNHFASPAQGSTLNAGQFGSTFAQYPCRGCAPKLQAYDAQAPARPQKPLKHLFAALLVRTGR